MAGSLGQSDSASRLALARAAKKLAGAGPAALILMTDDERLADPIAAAKALPKGSMVIVRARDPGRRRALAGAMARLARQRGLILLVAGEAGIGHGVHLAEAKIGRAASLKARGTGLITAAAHSPAALRRAGAVDALIFSPVFATASHPGRAGLGAVRANLFARQCPKPVYALGGITAQNAARLSGFCGIAAIGALAVD